MVDIRPATADDIPALATLCEEYMRELFHCAWSGSREALARDGFGAHFRSIVATSGGELVGFAAWTHQHDLHTVGEPATRRLYERVVPAFPGADCILGGRAFRTVAALAKKSPRAMVRGLPDKATNWEP